MADTGEKSYIAKESTLQTVLTQLGTLPTKTDLESSLSSVGGGAVAKIQRGTISITTTADITLSGFTDVNKMVVLINGNSLWKDNNWSQNEVYSAGAYITALTTNKLSLSSAYMHQGNNTSGTNGTFDYQVIQYK